jgi:cytochrome c551/c552
MSLQNAWGLPTKMLQAAMRLDKLTIKVLKGGVGVWGNAPMPSNPQVSEAEARKLVAWVLSQK